MRRRNIKTVAHWVIMCFILLFPILMVGVSAFAHDEQSVNVTETYEYETNDVNSYDDLIEGNIYKFNIDDFDYSHNQGFVIDVHYIVFSIDGDYIRYSIFVNGSDEVLLELHYDGQDGEDSYFIVNDGYNGFTYLLDNDSNVYFVLEYIKPQYAQDVDYFMRGNPNAITISDYLGEVTTNVDIQNSNYKQEVNNWANSFKNLPVNQWYGQLLDVCGVGQTTNSVMNVMYVYPLYVLWVYLLDLILDCLLVIVNLGHNALKRLDSGVE